ncbi:AMP-binding protein [Rhodococcus sp. T2V]|uniref:AMP-binding protein n=1 Tax=Rhodococcus sp. T2V TaxID=3034164 RepID=UPI0023E2C2E6|nr:AMP-binding protein [Rhodococcus sp. T2V]MDF3310578.1 AMP-binding protein [Rhodococcus sp. T2V]
MTNNTASFRAARDALIECQHDLDRARREFRWPTIEGNFNWAIDWFDVIATSNTHRALVILNEDGTETSRSFDEIRLHSNKIARWLATKGVKKGDSVIVMLNNQVELWESMTAVMKLGAVIVPTTTAVGEAELIDRLHRTNARHVICNADDTSKFDGVPGDYGRICVGAAEGWSSISDAQSEDGSPLPHPETTTSDRLLLYFTSGTTSRPKLVEHTQVSYPVGHLTTMYWLGLRPRDVHLNISSPGWAKHAWSSYFAPWIAEATIFVYNYKRFDAAGLLEQLKEKDVTSLCAPPTVWRMLIQADMGEKPKALRELIGAGEPLNPEVIAQVRNRWGLTLRDGFGQTEITAVIGNTPGAPVKPGSMGRPLPGAPVVLVNPVTGVPVTETGVDGEICLDLNASENRPVMLMTGYQQDPERNAEAMAGGYYHTGDVASVDGDGYFSFVGRTDDVFKASDYKISPFELESVLIEHPAVAEVAVVPAHDPVRLAVPKAYVVLAAGFEPTADTALHIFRHARENLAPYLRVRRIEFHELPKTISGKIRRVDLRRLEGEFADRGISSPNEWRDDQFHEQLSRVAGEAR